MAKVRTPCKHGSDYMIRTRNGGRFCKKCWLEKKKRSSTPKEVNSELLADKILDIKEIRVHDPNVSGSHYCINHGPHYLFINGKGNQECSFPGSTHGIGTLCSPDCQECKKFNVCKTCIEDAANRISDDERQKAVAFDSVALDDLNYLLK